MTESAEIGRKVGWTSSSKQLPQSHKEVLVWLDFLHDGGGYDIAHRKHDKWTGSDGWPIADKDVQFWMELPARPDITER